VRSGRREGRAGARKIIALSVLAVALAWGCDDGTRNQPQAPAAPAIPTPTPAPATPAPTPLVSSPLTLGCQASPRSGDVPLSVRFRAFPGGGTGVYDVLWRFGDGETSSDAEARHTYLTPGVKDASVTVSSGGETLHCSRPVTVTGRAAPPPRTGPPSNLPDLVITINGVIGGMSYSPAVATARVGQRVVWRNADISIHTATADGGAFDTGFISPGASGALQVTAAGTFPYHCTVHPTMTGTLNVVP
jgi:plastocyanin